MDPRLEGLDPLHPLRRRAALVLLPLGGLVASVALWTSWPGGLDPVDRVFLPPMALGLPLLALLLWRREGVAAWAFPLAHTLVALYLLATLSYQLLEAPNPQGLSPAAYWFPFVYFSAFLFFPSAKAVQLGLAYWSMALVLALLSGLKQGLDPRHLNALVQFLGSGLAYLVLLSLLVRIRLGYLEAQALAHQDPLTGLPNRRYLDQVLGPELLRAQRYGRPLALAFLDLDLLKRLNDTLGHEAGDRALRLLAQCLQSHLRQSDLLVRFAGDEFVLLLPETDLEEAQALAERLRQGVKVWPGFPPGLSLSLGVTEARTQDTPELLLARADQALYLAKERVRDRVEVL